MTTTAKLFRNGRTQAVRLPREFRFEGDRARVRRAGRGLLVEPMLTDVSAWFAELDAWPPSPSCRADGSIRPPRSATCSMTTYLLDTNARIALINGTQPLVRRRFQRAVARGSVMLLSSVVAFELWYGVGKGQRKENNTQRLEAFFAGPLEWTPFDDDDARVAGAVRAELEAVAKPIGAYDVPRAGQARRRGATLVTSNVKEFGRVVGLKWEDWAGPAPVRVVR